MTFSQQVKEEICRNEYSFFEKKAILSSFLKNIVSINISNNKIDWEIKSKTPLTIRFITQLLIEIFNIKKDLFISEKKTNKQIRTYKLEFTGDFSKIEKELMIFDDPSPIINSHETKAAFIAGLFLCGGSINNPLSSNYHFEVKIHNFDLFSIAKKIFNFFKIKFSFIKRKNNYILYVKKSESISDILKIMHANDSMFEYEEKRIYRDYSNQMSRLNNLDISNLKKTAIASHEQVIYIKFLKEKNLYDYLSDKEKKYCELRLKYPEASLNDLSELFKMEHAISISRTGINHFVRKIKKIYEENNKILKK